jgi:hypothetical protein
MIQKGENRRSVQISHAESRGLDTNRIFHKDQQQAERVTAAGQCLWTDAFLATEIVTKERLDVGCKG